MKELLDRYSQRPPEIVFEWSDSETEARGWVVINSLRGGAAGGGTRMRKGLDKEEVISLAKTMEIKFTVSGPQIGGAKSGINFDPTDPRKEGVLRRWYKAVTPLLKHYYGTGGDLNVDAGKEVIPMTEACGVWHPQEGVFNGHFKPNEAQKVRRIGHLRQGVSQVVENPDFPRWGIHVRSQQGYDANGEVAGESSSARNQIVRNRVVHSGESSADFGALSVIAYSDAPSENSTIAFNSVRGDSELLRNTRGLVRIFERIGLWSSVSKFTTPDTRCLWRQELSGRRL